MAFEFERFEKIGSIFKSRVSISRTGVISFTEGAKNLFKLTPENAKYVELYYDKHARVIGLNFVPEQNGAVVTTHFRETGLDFATKAFLDYYDIMRLIMEGTFMINKIFLTNITCEGLKNPLGIDCLNPRFSYEIISNMNNVYQESYQIIVKKGASINSIDKEDF